MIIQELLIITTNSSFRKAVSKTFKNWQREIFSLHFLSSCLQILHGFASNLQSQEINKQIKLSFQTIIIFYWVVFLSVTGGRGGKRGKVQGSEYRWLAIMTHYFLSFCYFGFEKICNKTRLFQVGLVVDGVKGVAREVNGEEEGAMGKVEAKEEILSEGVTIREPINTTAEVLCYQLIIYAF